MRLQTWVDLSQDPVARPGGASVGKARPPTDGDLCAGCRSTHTLAALPSRARAARWQPESSRAGRAVMQQPRSKVSAVCSKPAAALRQPCRTTARSWRPRSEPTLPATAPPLAGSPHPVRPARKTLAKPGQCCGRVQEIGGNSARPASGRGPPPSFPVPARPCRLLAARWRPGKQHQRPDAGRGLTLDIIDGRLSSSVGQRRAPSEGCSAARPSRLTSPPPSGS